MFVKLSGYQMCLICAMAQTLLNSQKQHSSMTPSLITNKLHVICKHLTLGRQEDAHEFLRYLVENMEKSYLNRFRSTINLKELEQYSKETTPLNQILGGYLRSTVTCLSCKHESVTFQHFMDLALDISRVTTLNDALAGYFARENLEECDYKCESCKKKVSATKRFSLERAPVVLCIQLKRFNAMMGKLGKQIQINMNLDLQKHLRSGDSNQNCNYRLVSLVTHLGGSANGGHYTAIGLAPNNNYYQFDDSCVSQISTESVLRTNAYLLFYELTSINNKNSRYQNGHQSTSSFSHTEHTYSKSALSASSTYLSPSTSFAKPKLPILPVSIIRQNNQKQKENETTPPSSKSNSSSSLSLSNGKTSNGSVSTKLFSSPHKNGNHDSSDDEESTNFIGPKQPSMPRLSLDDTNNPSSSTSSSPQQITPTKPKSLVPYYDDHETDDEEDESERNASKKNGDSVNFLRTSSGVFLECEVEKNCRPSKEGSTVDKIVITKATTNGITKPTTNGFNAKRNDDTLQQLTKLNHSGYGTSDVNSWNNTKSNMSREVDHDQREDRKRHAEDDDEEEMDMGRVKKVKYGNNYSQSTNHQQGGKLPNLFQETQNNYNQNGNGYRRDVSNHYNSHHNSNGNGFNRNSNQKHHKKFSNHGKHHGNSGNYHKNNNNYRNLNRKFSHHHRR
jgi:ubiquitin carboxyl-terminal hydrolase 36/42